MAYVWSVQILPNLIILAGICALDFLYELSGRHTSVVALVLLLFLALGLIFVWWLGRGPHKGE